MNSVWKVVEDGDTITALCRAEGSSPQDKEKAMEELAKALLPGANGTIFIAKQFMQRGETFGFTWNVSLFGEGALLHMETIAGPRRAGVGARHAATAPAGRTNLQKLVYSRGRMQIWEFPLPHTGSRNVAKADPRSPLGFGKGATPVKAPDDGYLM